jgi:predicted enzyme related to lactoylglutathione lyase
MRSDLLFVGVATADFAAAVLWYSALLGRPADVIVHDREVMWRVDDAGWIYLVEDPSRAGNALVTVAVADLDQILSGIAERGVSRPATETIEGAGRKGSFVDPEGNMVTFIQVLSPNM